jgi:hypothetical protein
VDFYKDVRGEAGRTVFPSLGVVSPLIRTSSGSIDMNA